MKIELYAIKDTLIGFSQPFGCASEAVALRDFTASATNDTPNVVNTYPEFKELWKIGIYDDRTGIVENDIKYIAKALDFIPSVNIPAPVDENTGFINAFCEDKIDEKDVLSNS